MEQNDQRNFMLAMGLMVVMFLLYNYFVLEPQAKARRAQQAQQAQISQVIKPEAPKTRDQIVIEQSSASERVKLDAPGVDGSVSLKGSRIDDVSLKNYYDTVEDKIAKNLDHEVQLLSPEGSDRAFYAVVNWTGIAGLDENTVWTQTSTGDFTLANPLMLTWSGGGVQIDRKISIDADYMFTVDDKITNTGAVPLNVEPVAAIRQLLLPEHLRPAPQAHAGVIGTYGEKKSQMRKYADLNKGKGVLEEVTKGWIGLTTKYWMAAAIPQQGDTVTMRASVDKQNGKTTFLAGFSGTNYAIPAGQSISKSTRIFAGAKRVAVLDRYQHQGGIPAFTDAVDWSWMFFITKPFFFLLQTFQGWFGSFGLAILALTVVVKTVFFPIQFNMYKTSARMRKIQPEMDEIGKRFGADPQRAQQEKLKIMQREKVNPVAGCLPMIPQIFIFYALFHTLSVVLEMRHTPFYGWIKDMSAPDPTTVFNLFGLIPWNPGSLPVVGGFLMLGVWPLLYALTMFVLQLTSTPPTDPTQKMIMRWMPLFYLLFLAQIASGLAIYYVWSNIISIGIQYVCLRHNGVETDIDTWIKSMSRKKESKAAE